jgi:hypothetical protein
LNHKKIESSAHALHPDFFVLYMPGTVQDAEDVSFNTARSSTAIKQITHPFRDASNREVNCAQVNHPCMAFAYSSISDLEPAK